MLSVMPMLVAMEHDASVDTATARGAFCWVRNLCTEFLKLDEADKIAETTSKRYSHKEIFDALRRRL